MKTPIPILFLISLLAVSPIIAQESTTAVPVTEQTGDDASNMETRITGGISDGKPGLPAPKPEPIEFEVERSVTKRVHVVESPEMPGLPAPEGTINVTVQLVKDPGLPDPPPPLPSLPPDDPAVLARLAELRESYRGTEFVFVSATVYDHSRTYLRCYPSGGVDRKEVCGWSNIDFNHFSGFATYQVKDVDGDTRQCGLLMGLGNENTQQRAEWLAKHDREYKTPEIPELPDLATGGPAFVVTGGDTTDREAMKLIEGMHNLYRVEGARMEEAYYARIKAYEERKAYLTAHPPVPKDVTIRYWNRSGKTANADQIKRESNDEAK